MLVKITAGTFGHQTPTGRVVLINTGEVVEVAESIGKRLIAQGCAAEAHLVEETQALAEAPKSEAETAKYNINMSREELMEIGEKFYGIDMEDLEHARNKKELIALLDEAKAEYDEAVPSLNAADAIV